MLLVTALIVVAFVAIRLWQDRPQPRPWERVEGAGHVGRSFGIAIDTAQCNPPSSPLDRVEVEETSKTVTVTAYVEPLGGIWFPPGQDACLSPASYTVQLDQPLADRTLRDGFDD